MRSVKGRRLQEAEKVYSDKYLNFVDTECDLSENSLLKECDFSWDIIQSKDQKEILMKFDFKNKAQVSLGEEADYVLIKLWGARDILSEAGKPIFREPFAVRVRIPMQIDEKDTSVVVTTVAAKSFGSTGEVVIWIQFAFRILFKGAMA
jgi:hypothetical protein